MLEVLWHRQKTRRKAEKTHRRLYREKTDLPDRKILVYLNLVVVHSPAGAEYRGSDTIKAFDINGELYYPQKVLPSFFYTAIGRSHLFSVFFGHPFDCLKNSQRDRILTVITPAASAAGALRPDFNLYIDAVDFTKNPSLQEQLLQQHHP